MFGRLADLWWHLRLPAGHRKRIRASRRALRRLRPLARAGTADAAGILFASMRQLDPLVFEEFVLSVLADFGYRIRRNRRYSGDGGIDGWVRVAGAWCPLQCKRYSAAINPRHVAEFSALLSRLAVPAGFFVHTGRTGPGSSAAALERDTRVTFISGERLRELIAGDA